MGCVEEERNTPTTHDNRLFELCTNVKLILINFYRCNWLITREDILMTHLSLPTLKPAVRTRRGNVTALVVQGHYKALIYDT